MARWFSVWLVGWLVGWLVLKFLNSHCPTL